MGRTRDRVSLGAIARQTVATWRRRFWSLTLLAALIEVPLVLAEVIFHIDPTWRVVLRGDGWATGAGFVVVYGAMSHHLMAGLLEGLVAEEREGHDHLGLGAVLRHLPWRNLLLADLLLTAMAFVGFLAFVIPGLVVLTWFSIVGPVINMERQGVLASFRRSHHLARLAPASVAFIAVTTFLVPEIVIGGVVTAAHTGNVVVDAVLHAVPATLLLPLAALPLVIVTFDLVAIDSGRRSARARRA